MSWGAACLTARAGPRSWSRGAAREWSAGSRSTRRRRRCGWSGSRSSSSGTKMAGMGAHPYREGAEVGEEIIGPTGNDVAGFKIERYLGVVRGIVVRAPSIGQGFIGAWKQIVGGNIQPYEQVC